MADKDKEEQDQLEEERVGSEQKVGDDEQMRTEGEDEAKPQPTFTKEEEPEAPDELGESDDEGAGREGGQTTAHSDEASLDDLAKEEEDDTFKQQIPPLDSSSSTTYFQRNFQRGVNQTISPNRNRSSKIHLLILLIIGLVVIGGTVYLLKSQFPASSPTPSPSEEPQATPSPTATPQALDRGKFKVRVLNGTSTTGLAASVSAKLKNLGYQTDKVANATNSAFARTVVRIKGDVAGLLEQLTRDLAPEFEAISETALKDNDSADAEVILGKK